MNWSMKPLCLGFAVFGIAFASTTATAVDETRFAVLTDTHLAYQGTDDMKMGEASIALFKSSIAALNEIDDLDFVVLTGDLLLDGEPWNLDLIKGYLDDLKVPYYVTCGNHDYAVADQARPGGTPYVGVSKSVFVWTFQGRGFKGADSWWSADPVSGLHIIGLDSSVPTHWGGHIPAKQLKWLDAELAGNSERLQIVFAHHSFVAWSPEDEPGGKYAQFQVDNAPQVRSVFEKHRPGLQVVISGHRHIGLRHKEVNGVFYFVCPATVSYPNQYTISSLSAEELSYETKWVPIDPEVLQRAKTNLLKAEWWRPTNASDEEMLRFFEGSGPILKKGAVKLQSALAADPDTSGK
jgi:3',5'-cyclic AMP phosphodiesterase CpdA